jgi:hypothetical protein
LNIKLNLVLDADNLGCDWIRSGKTLTYRYTPEESGNIKLK